MRIGIIVDNELNNDKRVLREAAILKDAGHMIRFLCFGFKGEVIPSENEQEITRISISRRTKDILFFFLNLIPAYEWMWSKAILRFIRTYDPETLHVHDLYMSRAAHKAIGRSGKNIKLILDLHENYPYAVTTYNWTKGFLRSLLSRPHRWKSKEKEYLDYADGIILLSADFRDVLIEQYPNLSTERFTVLPNVPDLNQMESCRSAKPAIAFGDGITVVLYFGVVAERRGIFDVLDVFEVLASMDHPSAFLVIGPVDRKDKKLFFGRIGSGPLKERIKYIPWISMGELQAYLDITDICIAPFHKNPQHESGVANKIYDYMLGGKPVVASDCRPQKRLIEKYRCGIIYTDKEQMKEAIIRLSADPGLRKEMGENGKRAIHSEYNIAVQGKVLADLYAGLDTAGELIY